MILAARQNNWQADISALEAEVDRQVSLLYEGQ